MGMESIALDNVCTMLNNRGYIVIERTDNKVLAEDFDENKILVICSDEQKLNMSTIKEILVILEEHSFNHCILIYKESITSSAKKIIETLPAIKIELFSMDELQYNLIEHELVPLHERLEGEEMRFIKKEWGSKLPTILKNDAVSRYYNYSRGDIIKVTRPDGIVYRIVK